MVWLSKIEIYNINIGELLDNQHNQHSSRVEKWMCKGSVKSIKSVIQYQLVISKIALCKCGSYFPYSKELKNIMKGLFNIQNEDN